MNAPTAGRLQLSYLGLVQFLFLLTWVVSAIYLGPLLAKLGLPKEFAPRLLLLDQVLFACANVLLGLYADRVMRLFRGMAPGVLILNLIACLAFIAIPWLTDCARHCSSGWSPSGCSPRRYCAHPSML